MKLVSIILPCLLITLGFTAQGHAESNSANNSKIAEFYQNFPGSDADKNGTLTLTEMRTFITSKVRSSATSKNFPPLKRLLKKAPEADLNKDGVLTKVELIKFLQ